MRRLSALILLIPLAALLVGSVRLSAICTSVSGAACGSLAPGMDAMQGAGSCARTRMGSCGNSVQKSSCTGKHCCSQDGCHKAKDGSKDKDGGSCCLDCPLCTLVTVDPFFRFEMNRQELRVEYAVMREDNLSDYVRPHWKPPAFVFLSYGQKHFFI
jgi:hypothetical protein